MNRRPSTRPDDFDDRWYDLEPDYVKRARRAEEERQREERERETRARQESDRRQRAQAEDDAKRQHERQQHEESQRHSKQTNPDAHFGRILGLSGRITRADIKRCYRSMISKYHPDRVHDLGVELKELAEQKTKEINEAYEYFSHKYDL